MRLSDQGASTLAVSGNSVGHSHETTNVADIPASGTPAARSASANSAESSSSRDAVRRAFDTLEPHHRTVLELAYWQGLSQREIAEKMQQPLGTVKSWTRQALRDLRGALPEGEWW